MHLFIGIITVVLVVFFSALLGLLFAASIGIRRNDRGHYRALRSGTAHRSFSGAGRALSGVRFPEQVAVPRPRQEAGGETGGDGKDSAPGRERTLI
ncbi:hypothetical protein [Nocardiopsis potens]|uniref:hypothetical protein n=1 Tax=Nocardiopsis potens TaxID=1246458 RepID=UPI0003455F50|nr:hypothetical protein [Nocardiopsis potens]